MKTIPRTLGAALAVFTFGASLGAGAPDWATALPPQTNAGALGSTTSVGLSADGRYALLASSASNFAGIATDPSSVNLYRVDTQTGEARLVSRSAAGNGGADENCVNAAMSADGQFVAFQSGARNLDADDIDHAWDLFLWDAAANTVRRITAPLTPFTRHADSTMPSISADGGLIAFSSAATDIAKLPTTPPNAAVLFYLHDRAAGTNRGVLSRSMASPQSVTTSNPIISRDGKTVFFEGSGINLVTLAQSSQSQVYAYNLEQNRLIWVSTNAGKIFPSVQAPYGDTYLEDISADGRYCLYSMDRADARDTRYLFRHEVAAPGVEATTVVATNFTRVVNPGGLRKEGVISGDGSFVAYATNKVVYRWRSDTGARDAVNLTNAIAFTSTNQAPPLISMDGRFIAFVTPLNMTNNAPVNTNSSAQIFIRDMQEQTTTLATAGVDGLPTANGKEYDLSMSDDGRALLFSSANDGLTTDDTNGSLDTFLWTAGGSPALKLLSGGTPDPRGLDSFRALQVSAQPASASGRWMVFSALHGSDTNMQVWLRDLNAGTVTLVSRAEGTTNGAAGASLNAMISANGRWIAYNTFAKNILPNDANNRADIVLADRLTGNVQAISLEGIPTLYASGAPSLRALSPNGQFIGFAAPYQTSLLDSGAFIWDRFLNRSTPVIRDTSGGPARGQAYGFVFSADSSRLALVSQSGSLVSFFDPETYSLQTTNRSLVLLHEVDSGRTVGLRSTVRAYPTGTSPGSLIKFSPDGARLVAGTTNEGLKQIVVVNVNDFSSSIFPLSRTPSEVSPSLNAGKVAYLLATGSSNLLGVLDTATGQTNVLDQTNTVRRVTMASRGDKIYYTSQETQPGFDTNGVPDTYVYAMPTGTKSPLVVAAGYERTFSAPTVASIVTSDGSRIFLATSEGLTLGDDNVAQDIYSFPLGDAVGAPVITQDPVAATRHDSEGVTLFVGSSLPEDSVSYQWYFKGAALQNSEQISGADTATLRLRGLSAANAGNYYAVVSNGNSSATSAAATVTVQPMDLAARLDGANLQVSWPATITAFDLQIADELADADTVWQTVFFLNPVTLVDGRLTTSLPASLHAQFLRLKSAAP